jgi:hypothetical protein
MNRHQPTTPRTLIGIAAFALSALTIAATVVLPAKMSAPASADAGVFASVRSPAALTTVVPDFRLRLDVVGVRQPDVAAAEPTGPKAKRDRQG